MVVPQCFICLCPLVCGLQAVWSMFDLPSLLFVLFCYLKLKKIGKIQVIVF